jgi:hypothetical protein
MINDLTFCGWRVHSELSLPELCKWTGDVREPDVTISYADSRVCCERSSPDAQPLSLLTHVCPDGAWCLNVPTVGKFIVRRGKEILISPTRFASAGDLRLFALGPALAICCAQRRLLPIRATTMVRRDGAVAICGEPGVGKSAVSLLLSLSEYKLLSDGLSVLVPPAESRCTKALATHPFFFLWRAATDALGIVSTELAQPRQCLEKFVCAINSDRFDPYLSTELGHIVILVRRSAMSTSMASLVDAEEVFRRLQRFVYFQHSHHWSINTSNVFLSLKDVAATTRVHTIAMENERDAAKVIEDLLA